MFKKGHRLLWLLKKDEKKINFVKNGKNPCSYLRNPYTTRAYQFIPVNNVRENFSINQIFQAIFIQNREGFWRIVKIKSGGRVFGGVETPFMASSSTIFYCLLSWKTP
jgi:hypothetical protein